MKSAFALALTIIALPSLAAVKDTPFKQDVAVRLTHASELTSASYKRLLVDRDDVAYVLTDRGAARLFETTVALDRSYRPLTGKPARDLALGRGWVHNLFEDRWLSNGDAGKPVGRLPTNPFQHFAVADDGTVILSAPDKLSLFRNDQLSDINLSGTAALQVFAHGMLTPSSTNAPHGPKPSANALPPTTRPSSRISSTTICISSMRTMNRRSGAGGIPNT